MPRGHPKGSGWFVVSEDMQSADLQMTRSSNPLLFSTKLSRPYLSNCERSAQSNYYLGLAIEALGSSGSSAQLAL